MAKKKERFTIKDKELATWFSIQLQRLDEIVDFFDSDPNDEWDLVEKKDYIFINKTMKSRNFSPQGALKIAAYLDQNETRGIIYKIKDFITQHDARIRKSLARKIITEELIDEGKIIIHHTVAMIHKQSLRRILETNGAKMNATFNEIQASHQPLELDKDYAEIENEYWFGERGVFLMSKRMSETLKDKSRRKACKIIYGEFPKQFKALSQSLVNRPKDIKKEIENAKKKAKTRDKKTCQITGKQSTKEDQFNLAVHHLYCSKKYPHLATVLDNLITIREDIHKEFHGSLGGFDKPCTLDDFIEFVHHNYPDHKPELIVKLQKAKKVLGQQMFP